MLQSIREHTQGWIAGAIVTIIIISFALWGIHSYFIGGSANSNVAKVNGVEITKEQLAVAYERLRRQVQAQYGSNNPFSGKEGVLKQRALEALIDMEVLKQSSIRQGFEISDMQVDSYLQGMPDFQVDGHFSVDRFHEVLSATLLSTSEFLDLIRTSLLVDQPKIGIMLTSFALPNETAYTVGLVNQERNVNYAVIPMQRFMSQDIQISPEKIEAYYDKHKSDFMTPEMVNVDYLELSLKTLSENIKPSDATLKMFYNENINSYTLPMQWTYTKAEITIPSNASEDDIKKLLQDAESLAEGMNDQAADISKLAAKYNAIVDTEKAKTLNQVPVELQKAVADLSKPGEVSEPFRTANGIAIVKAVEIKEPKVEPFDSVIDKVKATYVHQRAEEKFAELRDKLADLTYEHPDSLAEAAKELDLQVKSSDLFSRNKAANDISQYKKVRDTAFSNDVLSLQNNSDVIQINPETVIVLRIKSHSPSTLLPLKNVEKQIENKLKAKKAEALASGFAEKLQKKLQAGSSSLDQIAAENKLSVTSLGMVGRYSTKVDTAVLDLAFRMPDPKVLKQPATYDVTRLPNGYAIVALTDVKNGSIANDKQREIFTEQVQNSIGLLEYDLYKRSQIDHAKIKIIKQN